MAISDDRWTCPDCNVTEHQPDTPAAMDGWRERALQGHAARHRAERSRSMTTADALVHALETVAELRVRVVVSSADFDAVRGAVVRRSLPLEVFADSELEPGQGYVMTPRRGYR